MKDDTDILEHICEVRRRANEEHKEKTNPANLKTVRDEDEVARRLYTMYRYSSVDIRNNEDCRDAMSRVFGNPVLPYHGERNLFCPVDKYNKRVGASKQQIEYTNICEYGEECMALCYLKHGLGNKDYTEYEMRLRCHECRHYVKSDAFNFDKPEIPAPIVKINATPLHTQTILEKYAEQIEFENPQSFVYLISDGEYVKIGKGNNPYKRLNGIQTGNPKPCRILYIIPAKDEASAHIIEKGLHYYLRSNRLCGEWFDIMDELDRNHTSFNAEFNAERWAERFAG